MDSGYTRPINSKRVDHPLYLGALKAGEQMAAAVGDKGAAETNRRIFESGREKLEALWNGDYYIQQVPPRSEIRISAKAHKQESPNQVDYQYGAGCLSDQMLGQWFAHVIGFGHLLTPERTRKTVASIYRYNFKQSFYDHPNPQRIYALNDEKGLLLCGWEVTSSDIPHVLALSYTYELPIGPGKALLNKGGVAGKIAGGWQVSAIHLYQSGRPLFLEYRAFGANNPFRAADGFSFRPNVVAGVPLINPAYDRSCSGPLPATAGRQACQFYINPAAFVAPATGEFGNAPKFFSNLRAQNYYNEDISISKRTTITERIVVNFQANFFNAFNRVALGTGGAPTTIFNLAPKDLSAASLQNSNTPFGILTSQQNGARRIQFGLKLEF